MKDNGSLFQTFYNTVQIMIFDRIKTQNPIIDTIMTTVLISVFGCGLSFIQNISFYGNINHIIHVFFREPYKIKISGKNCSNPTSYGEFYISAAYSDGFNAILDYIITPFYISNAEYL